MKTLVIHVGDHKTGTSSIQRTLANVRNGRTLQKQGTTYCVSGRGKRYAHHSLADQILKPDNFKGNNDLWAMLAQEIQTSKNHNFIVSSENFENVEPECIKKFTDKYLPKINIRIILYIRPHISRLISSYSQVTKQGFLHTTLEDFIRKQMKVNSLKYAVRIRKWRDCYGGNIIARPFIRKELHGKNVIDDFLKCALNIKDEQFEAKKTFNLIENNVSPSYKIIEVMKIHGSTVHNIDLEEYDETKFKYNREYARHIFEPLYESLINAYPEGSSKPYISPELLEEIKNFYRQDAQRVDRRCFGKKSFFEQSLNNGDGVVTTPVVAITPEEASIHLAYADFIKKSLPKLLVKAPTFTEEEAEETE